MAGAERVGHDEECFEIAIDAAALDPSVSVVTTMRKTLAERVYDTHTKAIVKPMNAAPRVVSKERVGIPDIVC